MAEQQSAGEKTFEPTLRRLREARRRGNVWQSTDFPAALVLLTGIGIFALVFDSASRAVTDLGCVTLGEQLVSAPTNAALVNLLSRALGVALGVVAAPLAVLATAGLVGSLVQVRQLLSFEPLIPKLERINPVRGLQQRVFSRRALVNFLKALVKVVAAAAICWLAVRSELRDLLALGDADVTAGGWTLARLAIRCGLQVSLFFLAFSLLDILHARQEWLRSMRMSLQEVKRERKQEEGDPQYKQRRREEHTRIAMGLMLNDVARADVVTRNPTHYACALRFDPARENAPRLLAKGVDRLAERIVRTAEAEGVPVQEDVELTRALYSLPLGEPIPPALYDAVEQLLLWVAEQAESGGRQPSWLRDPDNPEH